jgi:hypothetical protein
MRPSYVAARRSRAALGGIPAVPGGDGLIQRVLVAAGTSFLLLFVAAHALLCWALSVILDASFLFFCIEPFPIVASIAFTAVLTTTVLLGALGPAKELTIAGANVIGMLAKWGLLMAMVPGARDLDFAGPIQDMDLSTFQRWFTAVSGVASLFASIWLALGSLALFRNYIAKYDAVVVVLVSFVFASILFRKVKITLVSCAILAGYFLVSDTGNIPPITLPSLASQEAVPEPSPSHAATAILPTEIVISGGSPTWTTAYENLPIANSFRVVFLPGGIRVATEKSAVVNHDGLLKENGAPFSLWAYSRKSNIPIEHWLLPDRNAGPYCLVASVTIGNESPSNGEISLVRDKIVVDQGHSLHFWYNHAVVGEAQKWHASDSGAFRIKLIPTIAVLQ